MDTNKRNLDKDVVAESRAIYEKVRERLEPTHKGSFVVIDAASGDYEVDPSPAPPPGAVSWLTSLRRSCTRGESAGRRRTNW